MSNKKDNREKKFGFVVYFVLECETKGAVRYTEVAGGSDAAQHRGKIGTLYVRKAAFKGKYPNELTVRVRSAKQPTKPDTEV